MELIESLLEFIKSFLDKPFWNWQSFFFFGTHRVFFITDSVFLKLVVFLELIESLSKPVKFFRIGILGTGGVFENQLSIFWN